MFYINDVRFLGRAVKAAELKPVGESKVATFRLAANRRIKRRNGEYEEKTTYIDCEVWNQRAEYAGAYIKRGTPVLVRGQLETDEWTTNEGAKRSKLKIYASEIQAEKPRTDAASSEKTPEKASEKAPEKVAAPVANSNDLPF